MSHTPCHVATPKRSLQRPHPSSLVRVHVSKTELSIWVGDKYLRSDTFAVHPHPGDIIWHTPDIHVHKACKSWEQSVSAGRLHTPQMETTVGKTRHLRMESHQLCFFPMLRFPNMHAILFHPSGWNHDQTKHSYEDLTGDITTEQIQVWSIRYK